MSVSTLVFRHFHYGHQVNYRVRVRINRTASDRGTIDMMFGTSNTAYRGYIGAKGLGATGICKYYSHKYGQWCNDDVSRDWQYHLFKDVVKRLVKERVL